MLKMKDAQKYATSQTSSAYVRHTNACSRNFWLESGITLMRNKSNSATHRKVGYIIMSIYHSRLVYFTDIAMQ